MQSETAYSSAGSAKKSIISKLFQRFNRPKKNRITPEMHAHLNAPAQLFVWQADGVAAEEGRIFESLIEAIACAPDDETARAFIVTESGRILRPIQICKLKHFLATAE